MIVKDRSEVNAILARMESSAVDAAEKKGRLKAVLYGDSGVGKTVLAVGTAQAITPPDKEIIFVDRTEGWASLKNHPSLLRRVRVIPFESIDQLSVLANAVFWKGGSFNNVGAIIFDDADFMVADHLNVIWGKRVEANTSTLDPDKPERPDYLKVQKQFMEVLSDIYTKTPDVHLIMTAGTGEKKSDDGKVVLKTFPGFSPALAKEIKSLQGVVGYVKAKEVKNREDPDTATYERTIQVYPTSMIDAKSRLGIGTLRMPVNDFVHFLTEWVENGGTEDNEKKSVLLELETSKLVTGDDILIGTIEVTDDDDDTPVFVS